MMREKIRSVFSASTGRLSLLSSPGARVVLIAAVAALARGWYLLGLRTSPFYTDFFLDPLWHHQWAQELAAGDWLGREVFFRAPLYPYLLGAIYRCFGDGPLVPRLVQFGLGVLSSVLVYRLGRRVTAKESWALAGGLVFALYGPMIYYEGELLIPSLIVFLDLAGLLLLFRAREKPVAGAWPLAGLILGLSSIARPNVLLPGLFLAGWALAGPGPVRRRLLHRALPFAVALLLPGLMVTLRNGMVGGDYVFIASQGGVNFFIGNNPGADGKTAMSPGFLASAGDEYRDSVWLSSVVMAEREQGRKLSPSEVSGFWYRKSFQWLAGHPMDAAQLYGVKLFYLLHGHEIPDNNVPYFARNYSRLLSGLMWDPGLAFPGGIVIPLGILGMVLAWPRRRELWPLYVFTVMYAASVLLFFVTSRYRMPLVGPLIVFMMIGLQRVTALSSERNPKRLAAALGLAGALLVISNLPLFAVRNDDYSFPLNELGAYYYQQGEYPKAVKYFQRVLKIAPENSKALGNLGSIAFLARDYAAAEKLYRRALVRDPEHPALHNNLGLALEAQGDLEAAAAAFRRALELYPDYAQAKSNLARVRMNLSPGIKTERE